MISITIEKSQDFKTSYSRPSTSNDNKSIYVKFVSFTISDNVLGFRKILFCCSDFVSILLKKVSKWNWDNVFSTPDTAAWKSIKYLNSNGSSCQLTKLLNKKLFGLFIWSNLIFSGCGSINIPFQLSVSSKNLVLEYKILSSAPNLI